MASVDDRIVRLEFDNAQFQSKINQTLTSLAQLDKALKLEGAQKGLADVNAAAQKTDLSGLSRGIEGISKGFLALSTIAITALANITSAAMHAGVQIVKSLALDTVIAGFREYETNISSIQTILANTKAQGTNLQMVNDALDQLNQYSDKTIYNFGQMAKNIGTFTAAGVDLGTSVQSIKGIANLAAISGSSAEQASVAMYQLSQAIATGSVKLMDWNSVVNAGMGGKGFQEALFNTGKALKTIPGVPIDQTFKQWTDAGNSFRESLQDGWVTADVLTTTLQGYTGEMTEAQLVAKGFTAEAARQLVELGKTGVDAATKVRTFTGLMQTTKEAIGSGWSASFRIIIGNFEEATELFTNFSQAIGKVVSASADARNKLLQGWKDLGGRAMLIEGITTAFHNLGEILRPIKEAFREIFPPMTAQQLVNITKAFVDFAEALKPSQQTIDQLKRIFTGFFAILDIGWTVVKEGVKFIVQLAKAIFGLAGGDTLELVANFGDLATGLHNLLVEGGGIAAFFEGLTALISAPISWLQKLRTAIGRLFGGFDDKKAEAVESITGRVSDRFENLRGVFERLKDAWKPLEHFFEKVKEILEKVWDVMSDFFSTLGQKIADVMSSGQYDNVLDTINTGLLAAITAAIIKWIKSGFNINVGVGIGGGIFDSIQRTFDQLTGTLKALQTQIKAEALMKIAIAIGILTASVLVLSMIDSAALTKALAAMAVGFGQLMAAFAILTKLTLDPRSALSFSILAIGMIALSASMILLAIAAKQLAELDWGQLARGLTGTLALLGLLVIASKLLQGQAGSMIRAGVGIAALSVGLLLLSASVKIFAGMSWGEMIRGIVGLAVGLGLIVAAMNLMPPHMAVMGVGLLAVGVGLIAMGAALKIFGSMSWAEIGRGLVALAGGLLLIGLAMYAMPDGMIAIGIGLTLVGIGLNILARALKSMGAMSWEEIARGLVALAGALIILNIGVTGMSGSLVGAVALGIVSGALIVLAGVLKLFSKLSWGDLIQGLLKLAVALAAIAIVAVLLGPAVPALLGLAIALGILGIAFLAFGAGAMLVAKAFEMMAKAGAKGAEMLGKTLEELGKALPAFGRGLAEGLIATIKTFADGFATLIPAFAKIIGGLLTALQENLPLIIEIFGEIIDGIILLVYTKGPDLIDAGLFLLMSLLAGIRDNIGQMTTTVVEIVVEFLNALASPDLMSQIAGAGLNILVALIQGILNNIRRVVNVALNILGTFITEITRGFGRLVQLGADALIQVVRGIANNLNRLVRVGVDTVIHFIQGLGQNAVRLADAAMGVLVDFLNGLAEAVRRRSQELRDAGKNLAGAIIDGILGGWGDNIGKFWHKLEDFGGAVKDKFTSIFDFGSPSRVTMQYGAWIAEGFAIGIDRDKSAEIAAEDLMHRTQAAFEESLTMLSDSLPYMDEFNPTITPVLDLTQVAKDAALIGDYIKTSQKIAPNVSMNQARTIASTTVGETQVSSGNAPGVEGGVVFQQTINAPTQLATADIYRQTRNQITIAKEELAIP